MKQVGPEEAVTIRWSNQGSPAEERLDPEALRNESLALEGPRSGVHGNILGEEDHRYLRKATVEHGQEEREDQYLLRLRVEGAPCVGLGTRSPHARGATSHQYESQVGKLGEPCHEAVHVVRES